MDTIGIITYHHYYNYGTMLQALALQMKIEELGYKCEIIDFKQNNDLRKFELVRLRIRRMGIYIKDFKKYYALRSIKNSIIERNEKFEKFYGKYLKVSQNNYTSSEQLESDPPKYDGYVVGSDQTWNPNVGKNPDAFYLSFVEKKNRFNVEGKSLLEDFKTNLRVESLENVRVVNKYILGKVNEEEYKK